MCFARCLCLGFLLLSLTACGDNLLPSGDDQRPQVQPGTTGPLVGQNAPDFSVQDTSGATVTLASALAGKRGAVLYFTMWCPICDSHMSNMLSTTIPLFPDVRFLAVDYVSGSVADARSAEVSNGYAGTPFTVVADVSHALLTGYEGTMGTTVVVDKTGVIRMSEDYRDGSRLRAVLTGLP